MLFIFSVNLSIKSDALRLLVRAGGNSRSALQSCAPRGVRRRRSRAGQDPVVRRAFLNFINLRVELTVDRRELMYQTVRDDIRLVYNVGCGEDKQLPEN